MHLGNRRLTIGLLSIRNYRLRLLAMVTSIGALMNGNAMAETLNTQSEATSVCNEPKRYPVVRRGAGWRSSDWPEVVAFKTLDEFAEEALFQRNESGNQQQPTEKRIILIQLDAPDTLVILSAIHKLAA